MIVVRAYVEYPIKEVLRRNELSLLKQHGTAYAIAFALWNQQVGTLKLYSA